MRLLTTPRLQLEAFSVDDLHVLHFIFTHPFIRKYIWDDEIIPQEQTHAILIENEGHFETDRWGLWKIVLPETRLTIGLVGLWCFFNEQQPQLMYGVLPEYTGHGFTFEAASKIVEYAFVELGFVYLTVSIDQPHLASRMLAQKLGMHFVEERLENGRPTVFYRKDKVY